LRFGVVAEAVETCFLQSFFFVCLAKFTIIFNQVLEIRKE